MTVGHSFYERWGRQPSGQCSGGGLKKDSATNLHDDLLSDFPAMGPPKQKDEYNESNSNDHQPAIWPNHVIGGEKPGRPIGAVGPFETCHMVKFKEKFGNQGCAAVQKESAKKQENPTPPSYSGDLFQDHHGNIFPSTTQ